MMHCHLLIPSLFPAGAVTRQNDPLHDTCAPALQTLLARSNRAHLPHSDMESWLCESFGAARQQDYPIAPLCLMAEGIAAADHYWLRADPVYMAIERDQLILEQAPVSPLSNEESEAFVAALNRHFAVDGLHFFASGEGNWYLRLDKAPLISTQTRHQALGNNVHPLLPSGPESMRWRALLNEIQMLLFSHPANVAREERGVAPINSVWLWGGGSLPGNLLAPFDAIWANDALAQGLALATGRAKRLLPESAEQWLETATPDDRHLLVLDSLRTPAAYGDPHAWREQLSKLEQRWFVPLKKALQRYQMELTLHIPAGGGTLDFYVKRSSLWKLWKPVYPLKHFRPPE